MRRFADLYLQLDQTNRTSDKVEAMRGYFQSAPAADAIWAVFILSGRKIGRTVSSTQLRNWAAEVSGYPGWLVDECFLIAGDLSETLSLILPDAPHGEPPALHAVVAELRKLGLMQPREQRETVVGLWSQFSARERFVLHKLISGNFRVGVSRTLMIRALAEAAGVEPAVMAHRLSGNWTAIEATMARLMAPAGDEAAGADPALPYPFMLAHALQQPVETLGEIGEWLLEWKWDGIRAQLLCRDDKAALWSRGDELVTETFPEIVRAAGSLPRGTVLDGEILGWDEVGDRPLTFAQLQPRINRKRVELSLWPDIPVRFIAFDLLEHEGKDVRALPLEERRALLERVMAGIESDSEIRASVPVCCRGWGELASWIDQSRAKGVEGLMIKRRSSAYAAGRPTGLWWKLKVQPYTVDAVLVAAQPGHGRRAGLLTDYTFAVWHEGELVTIAKAYSGLTDTELVEVDRFARAHTLQRYGPVYAVEPKLVFELGFEAIQKSERHKSGVAVRFPRILRIRRDKKVSEADTLSTLRALLGGAQGF